MSDRPNILYLHCHDAGRFIQPYGHPVPTPSLQRLAEEGVLFRQAFTTSPTCSPSRACLLTGQHAHVNGMTGLAHKGHRLKDPSHHLIHTLHDAGYTSALAGIQHVSMKGKTLEYDMDRLGYHRLLTSEGHYKPVTDAAVDYLHERGEAGEQAEPFFLSVGYLAPHRTREKHREHQSFPAFGPRLDPRYVQPPACLPDNADTRRDMAEYAASMRDTDLCMGRVLEALDDAGLADNTLVIATTDHGIAFPHMKSRLTDQGTGVMLILRGPGSADAVQGFRGGGVVDAMVTHLDVFPTVCDLLGLAKPSWLQGKSLMPLVTGEVDRLHDEIFGEVSFHAGYEPMRSVRTQRHQLIRNWSGWEPVNCDSGPSKRVVQEAGGYDRPKPEEELYDLVLDPLQSNNLIDDGGCAEVRDDLRRRLSRWMEETGDPLLAGEMVAP